MEFSYLVDNKAILKNVKIDTSNNKLVVITGVENTAFEILGGVVAGLFPIKREESFSQLEDIIKYFSGDLIVYSGKMPDYGLYMGADPDKHILFSKVNEEIYAQLGFSINAKDVIKRFDLDSTILNRKITTLSGGEKVKVALSILFSKETDCIVLHGVLPWLDKNGKNILISEIKNALNKGIKVIILEQEIDNFQALETDFYYFNGQTIEHTTMNEMFNRKENLYNIVARVKKDISTKSARGSVLEFKNVFFDYNSRKKDNLLLKDINFTLYNSRIYGLTGENGSGKSTIARLITRIITPIRGNINFEDEDLKELTRGELIKKICYVGQFPERQLIYGDVDQYRQKSRESNNDLSIEMLNKYFNTNNNYPISTLNPLQLKLLLLFSTINENTRLVILDEPTWGIDIKGQMEIANVIGYLVNYIEGLTIFLISHDQLFLNEFSTNMLVLANGRINELKAE